MGWYSNWTTVHETIPHAVTSNSVSLSVIWAELSKVSIQPQLLIRPNPAALARASDYENVFTSSKMKPQSTRTQDVEMCGRGPLRAPTPRSIAFFFSVTMSLKIAKNLTEKPRNFIGLLLLNLLIIQSFKEDVQDQYIFSGERTDKSTPKKVLFLVISHDTKWYHTFPVSLSFIIVTLKVNDGDPRHAMPQYTHPSTEKKRKEAQIEITDCYQIILTQYIAQFCWIS